MQKRSIILSLFCVLFFAGGLNICSSDITIDTSSPFLQQEGAKKISMDFQDAELVDVLKIFSEQTKYNLITAENIAEKKLTVYLDNVPVEQALEQVLRANNLTYELQPGSNIYIVKPLSQPDAELFTRVYPLRYATVSKAKISQTLSISAGEESEDGSSSGTQCAVGGAECGLLEAVKGILTAKGKVIEDLRTNSLIITDISSNFPNIEKTVARLDIPIPQILIEVEMLEVSKETADKIGIKAGETPFVFTGAKRSVLYPFDQNYLVGRGDSVFTTGISGATDQYNSGLIDTSGLSATIQFLKTQSDSKTLARPRILTLNNETAQIKISTDEAIGIENTTTGGTSITSSATQAERVETGVFLTVTPQANIETNDITMAVIPKVVVARTGGTFEGKTFKDPEERTAQSILKVKSGETIVIGGLLREEVTKILTKVPVLGDIPLIGRAFRHNDDSTEERELIIFLTPHIIKETPASVASMNLPQRVSEHVIVREQERPEKQTEIINQALAGIERKRL